MTLIGLIAHLQQQTLFPNEGEITETEFDRWLNKVAEFTLPATIYYPKTDEFIKLDADGEIVDRYPANPPHEEPN